MDTPNSADTLRLSDYLRPIIDRWWLVVAIVLVVTAATYTYYDREAPTYESSTQVFLADNNPLQGLTTGSDRNIENQAQLFSSTSVLRRVARAMRSDGPLESLLAGVTITPSRGADVITVTARSGDPQRAARLANAFADGFIAVAGVRLQTQIAESIKGLEEQLRSVPQGIANSADRATLTTQLRQLRLAQQTSTDSASQVRPAHVPAAPIAPNPLRNAIFAFALALIAAVSLAFGVERFDRRLKRVEHATEAYGLPIMTSIPHSGDIQHAVDELPSVSPTVKESFHQLRANLRLLSPGDPPRKVLVTSGLPGEGKSTVVRNLAIVLREWGQRVAVVDADLRSPSLGRLLATPTKQGLTDVLAGDCRLAEALARVAVDALGLGVLERVQASATRDAPTPPATADQNGHADVTLLGPGPEPANPPAVLLADVTGTTLDELLLTHDIVLVDSPPLLAVSDAMSLIPHVDAVILVGRLGLTTRDSAQRTAEVVERVPGAQLAGVVVNDVSHLTSTDYGYHYGYRYGRNGTKSQPSSDG